VSLDALSLTVRQRLRGRRVALCVTGSVAAYKAAILTRLLLKEGADVEVVMTASAQKFVGSATFAGLTSLAVLSDMFDPTLGGELHVDLAARSDIVVVVPATADLLARLAAGRADDAVTATVLCARCPVLVAPAMHPAMWEHPATQRNVATLAADGRVTLVGPVSGPVASGDEGMGRMVEPEVMVEAVASRLSGNDFEDRHVVVSAGPTIEDIDPVRFLGNRSSGKMGFAIAERAAARGARVTLVSGPSALPTPPAVDRIDVRTALEMREALVVALGEDLSQADALVMAAAVGDFRPADVHATKLKREGRDKLTLELVQNPDILAEIGKARKNACPVLVGFAVEADNDERVIAYARRKLEEKRVDLVVANHAADSFGRDDNRATFVTAGAAEALGTLSKGELAERLLDWIAGRLASPAS
jgi:phosphopantothenoylcysteine decarboxylase/phosphopantothenate--cysteine ligase